MIKLENIDYKQGIGASFSNINLVYNEYSKSKNSNIFEEVIDKMMLDKCIKIHGLDSNFKDEIKSLGVSEKRKSILKLMIDEKLINGKNDKIGELRTSYKNIRNFMDDATINKMDHIKDILYVLRDFVKVGAVETKERGEVMTPLSLVNEMLEKLPKNVWKNPNLKWFDSCNGTGPFLVSIIYKLMIGLSEEIKDVEKRYKHIVENMIYAGELNPENMFLYMCAVDPKDEYLLNVYCGDFLKEGFDYHMKNVWKVDKFDIIIGNPPYKGNLHLHFLLKSNSICDYKIIFVHPSSWLIKDTTRSKANKIENSCKDLVSQFKSSFQFINGNIIFGIKLFVPCIITYISKTEKNEGFHVIDSINNKKMFFTMVDDINLLCDTDLFLNLKNKFLNLSENRNLFNSVEDGLFYVSISRIRGNVCNINMIKDDFYTFIPKDRIVSKFKAKTDGANYGFNKEEYANNFLNYLKSNFARFSLLLFKYNSDLANRPASKYVPWLDFSQEWTDEKLRKEFNLTDDEINFINKNTQKYYD